jgi:DNA-binding NarL/FixJ family response regulator
MVRVVVLMETHKDREYFHALLSSRSGYVVVGTGKDGFEAIRLVQAHQPDIALVDEQLPFFELGKVVRSILFWSRETKVIIITSSAEAVSPRVPQAISAGASGHLGMSFDGDVIISGISLVMHGINMMRPEIAALVFKSLPSPPPIGKMPIAVREGKPVPRMNTQELRLLSCVGQGLSCREMSVVLNLKVGTVRNYLSALYSKTGLRNRTEAGIFAHKIGLS